MQKILALLLLALMMACQTTSPAASNPTPDPNSVSSDIKASDGGEVKLDSKSVLLKRCTIVGGYGLQPEWMDGHASGIYSFSYLRSLDPNLA